MRPTVHGRAGARVDYYRSVIGTPRVEMIEDPSGGGSPTRVVRVEGLREIFTCCECWERAEARGTLERAWRTGLLGDA